MRNSLRNVLYVCLLVCLAALVAFAPAAAWGQATSTGTIVGSVVDNTNAVVPGATVTIMLTTTGTTRTTTSDNQGRFVFADVDPGAYTVNVSKQGFSSTVVTNQVVKIGTQLTENVKMQVGAISTTVTVTENPGAELQTMDATVGTTLSGAMVNNLPNVTRDVSTLAIFQPGQNINGATGGEVTDQNSFQLDGGFATDDMSGDNNTYIGSFSGNPAGVGAMHSPGTNQAPSAVVPIPVSTVEEFKVSTANQGADFNGGAGSQMQVVTKRGTNTFHGTGYEYYLDNNFGGANTWDNNFNGIKQPSSHFSRFGANGGGKIPGANFAGGSWYLFGGYEGFRFPNSSSFTKNFPSPSLRAGLIKIKLSGGREEVINLNTAAIQDPALVAAGVAGGGPSFAPETGTIIMPDGTVNATSDTCPGGPCDPQTTGLNPVIAGLWNKIPLPNHYSTGDASVPTLGGVPNALYSTRTLVANTAGFIGTIAQPQKSNFGIARVDHDFAKNEHFNATYHYYHLNNTVANQWDIGGFFPGDTPGQYAAIRQKPQNPWIYTAGLTTDVTSNLTNDVHFSYTRNWWAYGSPSGVPNVAGMPAALELGGETSSPLGPYNTNNQSVRTRYWNGHDYLYRDDLTWIRGNHLLQFGGSYLRAVDTHNRNDNGEAINVFEQYIIGDGTGTSLAGLGIQQMNAGGLYVPGALSGSNAEKYGDYYSMVLGMIDSTQSLFTRGLGNQITGLPLAPFKSCAIAAVPSTVSCVASPSLLNTSIIPTYNAYITDSWHLRPSLSLNYGLGYTVEMPPFETHGGVQTVMVDATGHLLRAMDYLNNEKQAALQGLPYAPLIGFDTVRNVPDHSKYPYDPFYGGISPRIGMAWNLRPDTVVRAGYATIFGRINGVNPILVPMLTPGLLQPSTCGGPNAVTGGCGGDPTNVFRVGVNCPGFSASNPCVAPLPPPSAAAGCSRTAIQNCNLPQPWYPGFNDVATGSGETFDPNFHPDRSDELTLSVQHQFGPKILAEAGYIGRKITGMPQYYSLTAVPYMMTQGGQSFADAWKSVMVSTNYGTMTTGSVSAPCLLSGATSGPCYSTQQFFEAALTPAYCSGFADCTTAFITNNASNMGLSDPFDAWAGISNTGGFNFNANGGRSFTSDPVSATCTATATIGCNGQSPSILTTASNGYGNYNAGYLQLTTTDWHGLTMKTNFQYSNALGTGNVVQASSSFATDDPWNLQNAYGPQGYNEKFTFNVFVNYASPYYASQKGLMGRLLGGWTLSPLFVYGSGFPVQIVTANQGPFGQCGTFGECNAAGPVGANENGVVVQNLHYSGTRKAAVGSQCGNDGLPFNVFGNPDAACPQDPGQTGDGFFSVPGFNSPVRNAILGLDGQIGGGGPLKGLPFWNLDLGIAKNIKIMEKLSGTLHFDFTNVTNHMQPADPCFILGDQADWGVLGCGGNVQGNNPRQMQLGFTLDW